MINDTKTQILDSAEKFTKLRGFDAFSYRDIAQEIGIKTSSIHYHFPTKDDLAVMLARRYTDSFDIYMSSIIGGQLNGAEKIGAVFNLLDTVSGKDKHFCLCGMLAADVRAVSQAVRVELERFFTSFESGLEKALYQGITDGSIVPDIDPKKAAAEITAAAEGAMLIARVRDKQNYFIETLNFILQRIRTRLPALSG